MRYWIASQMKIDLAICWQSTAHRFSLKTLRPAGWLTLFLGIGQSLRGAVVATNLICGFSLNPLGVDDPFRA